MTISFGHRSARRADPLLERRSPRRLAWLGMAGLALAVGCGDPPAEPLDAGGSGPDGSPSSALDGGLPDLPDTGPPTCSDPDPWYRDLDDDGYGDEGAPVESCDPVDGFVREGGDCDDTCPSCWPDNTEACDGADNDCDGLVDETFTCAAGETVACTATCGTAGTGTCTSACELPTGAACTPPAEVCNGLDDDCDGTPDDGFECSAGQATACTTTCGSTGTGPCTSACGAPGPDACTPPTETCNGADDDCDGSVDETFTCAAGETVACTASCGTSGTGTCTSACELPTGAACTPPAEVCNGLDDDCDGAADQTFTCARGSTTACTTTCGSTGTGTCTASCGAPGASSCTPPSESCTYADDDCDGLVDEGVRSAGTALVHGDYYSFRRPLVARDSSRVYALWRGGGTLGNRLWRMNDDGTIAASRILLEGTDNYDLEASSTAAVYAYVDGLGDVHVHRLERAPTASDPFSWSREIPGDAVEVHLAVGSARVWVYTRESSGSIRYWGLDLASGIVADGPFGIGSSSQRIAVASNRYREHLAAWAGPFGITYKVFDLTTQEVTGLIPTDGRTVRDLVIAGDYDTSPSIDRRGFAVVYALDGPDEVRYFSYRSSTSTADRRLMLGRPADSSGEHSQLDLHFVEGVGQLAVVVQSGTDPTRGFPRVYQLARPAIGAVFGVDAIPLPLSTARHQGVSMLRLPAGVGLPDRLYYDPPGDGTASISIGCP